MNCGLKVLYSLAMAGHPTENTSHLSSGFNINSAAVDERQQYRSSRSTRITYNNYNSSVCCAPDVSCNAPCYRGDSEEREERERRRREEEEDKAIAQRILERSYSTVRRQPRLGEVRIPSDNPQEVNCFNQGSRRDSQRSGVGYYSNSSGSGSSNSRQDSGGAGLFRSWFNSLTGH